MKVILFMIAGSLFLGLIFLIAFIWSVRERQFEDTSAAANSILWDDESTPKSQRLN